MKIICRKHDGLIDVPGVRDLQKLTYRFNKFVFNCPVCNHQLTITSIQHDIIVEKTRPKPRLKTGTGW
jgi:transcription elongation factor Elf1